MRNIGVTMIDGESETRPGFVVAWTDGSLAVVRFGREEWTVTHVGTGIAFPGKFSSRAKARAAAWWLWQAMSARGKNVFVAATTGKDVLRALPRTVQARWKKRMEEIF